MPGELGCWLYYMAPEQNAFWIAGLGILSYNLKAKLPDLQDVSASIADPFVNTRRHGRQVGGQDLHDYVPLYWATHTPMQYVVTHKRLLPQDDLAFFVLNAVRVLALPGVWSTDGNAASSETAFYEGAGALPFLDWQILATPNCWSYAYKRKKCAEVLVPNRIGPELIRRVVVHSEATCRELREQMTRIGRPTPVIEVDPSLYY